MTSLKATVAGVLILGGGSYLWSFFIPALFLVALLVGIFFMLWEIVHNLMFDEPNDVW